MKPDDLIQSQAHQEIIAANVPLQYRLVGNTCSDAGLILYLHGYQDNGTSFFRRLYGLSENQPTSGVDGFAHLIPHAPFPVPLRTESGWKEAYSWYFYNEQKNQMLISPDAALQGLELALLRYSQDCQRTSGSSPFGPAKSPLYIACFSQGGYLMPYFLNHFLKSQLKDLFDLRAVAAIATGYDESKYPSVDDWALNSIRLPDLLAVHPELDPIFPIERVKSGLNAVQRKGYRTDFELIPGLDHRVSATVGQKVMSFLSSRSGNSSISSRNR